jgi:hypothetical protein
VNGLKRVAWTLIVAGLWAFLSTMVVYQWDVFNMGKNDWKGVLVGVLAAVGYAATNALAPWIKQYGIGAPKN